MAWADILIFAVNSVLPIILLVVLGYLLKRKGFFTKEFLKIANKTVFRVLLPVLLFTNLAKMENFSELRLDAVLYVLAAVALLFAIGLALAQAAADRRQKGVLLQCVFRSNFALIGVPLAQLMAGDQGVQSAALLSAFTIPVFNILSVVALSAYAPPAAASGSLARIRKILRDILRNPLILGVLAGIVFVFLKPLSAALPDGVSAVLGRFTFLGTALDYLAKASTPVALLVLGGQFEANRIRGLRKQILLGVTGRLVCAPLLGIGGAVLLQQMGVLHFDNGIYASFVALFATPVAVASAVMAEEMDNDGQLAGQLVVWTTLFSSLGIFVTVVVLRALGLL
ncbi:MAG: AEC family transporter [Muribaculum sp.]|nr:AEC family transporter [Muribaculum sp.]